MLWLKKIEEMKCPWCGKIWEEHNDPNACLIRIKYCCSLEVGIFIFVGMLFFLALMCRGRRPTYA